jgi:2'-5' RNA ligase
MPRLFTALEIPAELGVGLSFMRGGLPGATWIDPENYHITLRFIGDVDDRTADEVVHELSRVKRSTFDVTVAGLESFGAGKPHSVFATVRPSAALSELQAEEERLMRRIGLPPEPRRFTPHVTLARCKGAMPRDVATWLALRGGFPAHTFRPERVVLYSSKSSRGGGPYLVEEMFPLDAAAPSFARARPAWPAAAVARQENRGP